MITLPKDIEYIITDFDGVITDGFVYIPNNSKDFIKRVNFKDVMAVSIAIKNGYKVGIISGDSGSVIDYIKENEELLNEMGQNSILEFMSRFYIDYRIKELESIYLCK